MTAKPPGKPAKTAAGKTATAPAAKPARKRAPAPAKAPYGPDEASLALAAERGDLATIDALLARGVSPDAQDPLNGYAPLHQAAIHGQLAAAERLIAAGADLGIALFRSHTTPLYSAVSYGHGDVVAALLRAGAPLGRIQGRTSWTELHAAAVGGHTDIVKQLIAAGLDVEVRCKLGKTPLFSALLAKEEAWDTVPVLLEAGAKLDNIGADFLSDIVDDESYAPMRPLLSRYGLKLPPPPPEPVLPPLHAAAQAGDLATVQKLLAAGASASEPQQPERITPLHLAAAGNHVAVIDALIDAGADLKAFRAPYEWTPLDDAVAKGHEAATQRLLDRGADPNFKHPDGAATIFVGLHYYEKEGADVFQILLAGGANAKPALPAVRYSRVFEPLRPLFEQYRRAPRKKTPRARHAKTP